MRKRRKSEVPKRGEIWIVNFDPTIGSEIKKTRPAVILQNDIGNRHSSVTIVAAITSQFGERLYPTEVFVMAPEGGLTESSIVLLNQIRTIDKTRLVNKIGVLTSGTMYKIEQALQISLGIIETERK